MIIRARAVVTMEGAPIENGAVVLCGNKIIDVGKWPEVRLRHTSEVLDLGERVLLPGLINAHCHLDYTDLRGAIPPQASFTDWIRAINEHKAGWTGDDYVRSIERGFAEAQKFGTTAIVNFEAFPEFVGKVGPAPLRSWWLGEMVDVRKDVSAFEIFERLSKATQGDSLSRVGLAPHALYTASRDLYEEAAKVCAEKGSVFSTHLAESGEETQMFRAAKGPLFEFMKSIDRSMEDCGKETPVALFVRRGVRERWIVAHLNELTESDFERLRSAPKFSVAHCPRSHAFFGHAPFQLKKLRERGFNICLGTDSLASNQNLSLFAEMRKLSQTEPWVSPFELIKMATVNAAVALGCKHELGRLCSGALADLLALPFFGTMDEIYDEILSFCGEDPWLMIDGGLAENA